MKKIIIFGAGNYGRQAFEYYGPEKVAYFTDNNKEKWGKEYYGKRILSLDEFKRVHGEYQTVIAVRVYSAIAAELREFGVSDYQYYSADFIKVLKKLKDHVSELISAKPVILFGVDDATDILYRNIISLGVEPENILYSDVKESNKVGEEYCGKEIYDFEKVNKENAVIIISSSDNAYALDVIAHSLENDRSRIFNPFMQDRYYEAKNVIYNPYKYQENEVTEDEWNDFNINKNDLKEKIYNYAYVLNKYHPLFEHVEIETINRCNGKCSFCPVSAGHDTRIRTVMSDQLFHKIIDELAAMDYSGRLALFSNDEPFLDPDIIERHQYAREHLLHARMHLFTNGTLLTLEKFVNIMPYLDELIIDNYDQELKLIPNAQKIYDYCQTHPDLKKKVTIVLRKQEEILTSRGGDAPNRVDKPKFSKERCVLPFKQLIIRPDGKVSLCCNDPLGKMTLGDLNKESLSDVWYGEPFLEVRKKLMDGRENLDHCRYCDTFILF